MKTHLQFTIAISAVFLSALPQTDAALCGSLCALYTLNFNDEFNAQGVNGAAWNYRVDRGQPPRLSLQLRDNIAVGDGNMMIALKNQSIGGFNYTGGGLVSKRSFQYGYFEANMSLNDGKGWHSSFWLNAGNGTLLGGAKAVHTEIDVFEVDSIDPRKTRHNILQWQNSGTVKSLTTGVYTSRYDFRGWHVWGFLWTEEGVNVWIDGNLAWTQAYPPRTWQHNHLNIWLTSIAYRDTPDNSKLQGVVRTDYIRYCQRDYYLTAGSLCDKDSQTVPCPSNAGYSETGSWLDSSLEGYTKGLLTRYSQCGASGATASWTTTLAVAGTYQISIFVIVLDSSDTRAAYDVQRNGQPVQARLFVNQTEGVDRWLGILQSADGIAVKAGERFTVTVTSSGNGCTRADSVKFVRIA
ncbi:Endo-1,3-1,4-beta-glycanase EglC [Hypsizygus marmoreus]|uniref:Endo-1,3-1,4-beta-glycanase EglC n=1 Tax=Hypsizygus marmoreus TaxID=39966 RepID=A0A369J5Q7_HYPMA|nr:Endo-1,3-1,4-beta-glycanase EglC [Hypsizygus marmoreus]